MNEHVRMPSREGMLKLERAVAAAVALLILVGTIALVWGKIRGPLAHPVCRLYPPRSFSAIRTRASTVKKLLLLSVIIVSVIAPVRAARAANGREGLKRALLQAAIFEAIYVVLVTRIWLAMS